MKVDWAQTAQDHLDAIFSYIALTSPVYARRMVDRITRRSEQIASFPRSGRRVPEFDVDTLREVIEPPYRVIYQIQPDRISVLAVIHGAMDAFGSEPSPFAPD